MADTLARDYDTGDILAGMLARRAVAAARGPAVPISGITGLGGEDVYPPAGREGGSQYVELPGMRLPHPADLYDRVGHHAEGMARNLPMMMGYTAGPAGAITGPVSRAGEAIAASPLAQTLARYGAAPVAAIAAATPTAAGSGSEAPKAIDDMVAQQKALTAQREKAVAERDLQVQGDAKRGVRGGRGPNYDKSVAEVERLDRQLEQLGKDIAAERYNQSPEGRLKADNDRAAFEAKQKADEYGKPIREYLPAMLANSLPLAATAGGIGLAALSRGRFNKEYSRALEGYRGAEKEGNVAEMALRKAQLGELEKPSLASHLTSAAAAGLPAELRLAETAIDASRDPESRASIEAWKRIHDPAAMAWDVGTAGLSSALAFGIGSKFAPYQPDRSLGRAIAKPNPYGGAPALADDLASARGAGAMLRNEGSASPASGGTVQGAGPDTTGPLARILAEPSPTQRQLPAPEAAPSLPAPSSSAPSLPPGVGENSRGLHYDLHTGRIIPKRLMQEPGDASVRRPAPSKSSAQSKAGKGEQSANPEPPIAKEPVQIDDMAPMRYPNGRGDKRSDLTSMLAGLA